MSQHPLKPQLTAHPDRGAGARVVVGQGLWYSDPRPDLDRYWEGARPGWYPDPANADGIHYWDGRGWTGLITPKPPPLWSLAPAVRHLPPTVSRANRPQEAKWTWRRCVECVLNHGMRAGR